MCEAHILAPLADGERKLIVGDDDFHRVLVLIDDYYAWEGCSPAVHDFLSQRKTTQQIRQAASQLAYILK